MTELKSPPTTKPAHYRLSKATWEIILKEYREGATTTDLSAKWRVSEHALRKRITTHGSTKRDWGDAQAIDQAAAREAELEAARRNGPEAAAARLFDGIGGPRDEDDEADHFLLARAATRASGRAMRGRLWAEAKALAGLAETYARLNDRAVSAPPTAARMDLEDLLDIIMLTAPGVYARFRVDPDNRDDPDKALKAEFWRWHYDVWGGGQAGPDPLSAEAAIDAAIAAVDAMIAAEDAKAGRSRDGGGGD